MNGSCYNEFLNNNKYFLNNGVKIHLLYDNLSKQLKNIF